MAAKKRGRVRIGSDYFDAVESERREAIETPAPLQQPAAKAPKAPKAPSSVAVTLYLPPALLEEMRAASLRVPAMVVPNVSGIVVEGAGLYLAKLRRDYNGGKPFEPVPGMKPRTGRPVSREKKAARR